ncbi:MAG TPA: sugar porter family MFS transporter [Acidimicrobiia bacterium]|nr:sugar porter family MFS transporter [Acidimicrobiia bacterium]
MTAGVTATRFAAGFGQPAKGAIMTTTAEPATGARTPRRAHRAWMWMAGVAGVAIMAGLLFGYDQGVISGVLSFLGPQFHLSSTMQEVVTSWVTLGALFGALLAGGVADRFGRKPALLSAGVLFSIGAVTQAAAGATEVLVAGRFVIGLGVGVASVAAPLYVAEIARSDVRGRMVSTYQLAITIGILAAYIVDAVLTPAQSELATSSNWRWMLGGALVPGVLLIVLMFVMPESPRWLMKAGRRDQARAVTIKVVGAAGVDERLDRIEADVRAEAKDRATWGEVFSHRVRPMLVVGVGLALFQQVTGINAVIYYADEIFARAGFTTAAEQTDATLLAVGCVNVLATLVAVAFVDRFGRKPLLLAGLIGMFTSLTALGFGFLALDEAPKGAGPSLTGIVALVCLVVYIASFAFSLGPIVWTVISEIFPSRIRGRGISIATAANWAAAFVVSQTFLSLLDGIGAPATFWLFAAFCGAAFLWIWRVVPETKGKRLEDIQAAFAEHAASRAGA